jgi:uncharacterized protein (TIGR03790 family)
VVDIRPRGIWQIALLLTATPLWPQGPENVLVVENRNSALSRRVAEYYMLRRAVPPANLCAIDAPVEEEITRQIYLQRVAAPVGECLRKPGIARRILYIVTTAGVPLKISGSSGPNGDSASVDSELAASGLEAKLKSVPVAGPLRNPFFRNRTAPFVRDLFGIYLVTRLSGYAWQDIQAIIDRAMVATNRGKFVLDLSDSSDQPGNDWLRNCALLLPKDRVVIDESKEVLYGQRDVIGYAAWGSNDKARSRRFLGFKWLPGAIATEYVSTNGRTFQEPPSTWNITTWKNRLGFFAGSPQSLTADSIREGATAASGHVYEPYLTFTPRPDMLFPAYHAGRNLAESFYLSIPAVSWQNVVIGDPLARLNDQK